MGLAKSCFYLVFLGVQMVYIGNDILRNGVVGVFRVSEDNVYLGYNKWGNAYNGCGF